MNEIYIDEEEEFCANRYYEMLPEWAKDIHELHDVCHHTRPENIAENYKHFIAFNGQMGGTSDRLKSIKAEVIEGMFQRLNVTPEQIRKAIIESIIEWS